MVGSASKKKTSVGFHIGGNRTGWKGGGVGELDGEVGILTPSPIPFNPYSRQFLLTLLLCAIIGCKIEGKITIKFKKA